MKHIIGFVLLLSAAPCFAGTYTLTTTPRQDSILQRIATERSQTPMQVIRDQVIDMMRSWSASHSSRAVGIDKDQWKRLSDTTRAAICADLALATADCPDPADVQP